LSTRELLTKPEEGLVVALAGLAADQRTAPRASFSASLRDRIVAEAKTIEAEAADAFQRALDGASVTGEAAVLAGFAAALMPAVPMGAPVSLRRAGRERILTAEAEVISFERAHARRSAFTTRLSRRLAIAAAISAMMVSGSALAVAASADDTPVDSLYGVKKFRERVQTWIVSGTDEGLRRLSFAETRVDETEAMLDRDVVAAEPYEIALDDMQVQLTLASALIIDGQRTGGPGAAHALAVLKDFIPDQYERMSALAPLLPEEAQSAGDDALSMLEAAGERTEAAVGGCVICSSNPLVPSSGDPGQDGCASCSPDGGGGSGILPDPDPRDPSGPDDDQPGPIDEPIPDPDPDDPIPTPIPDPDRVPDLPGRGDDILEGVVDRATSELVGSI
jgi:hypothetical protein